jgi:hypothetical protein
MVVQPRVDTLGIVRLPCNEVEYALNVAADFGQLDAYYPYPCYPPTLPVLPVTLVTTGGPRHRLRQSRRCQAPSRSASTSTYYRLQ